MRCCVIESVESSRPRRARVARYIGRHRHAPRHRIVASPNVNRNGRSHHSTYRVLPLLQGTLHAERRNRGYTLYNACSGALIARLRPTGSDDRFEVLYWSLWKDRWASSGPFGRTVLSLDDALRFIAHEDIFWVIT
jgi:hypothetical protein